MGKIKKERISHNVIYYFVIFCIMILLIVTIMGGYLYRFYYKTMYTDFLAGNEQYLSSVMERQENDLQIMDNIVYQVGMSEGDTMFKLENDAQKAIELKKHLRGYTTVSQSFNMLLYYYHEDSYFYNYSTSISLNSFWKNGCSFEETVVSTDL